MNYILRLPTGELVLIVAKNYDDLMKKLGDNPYYDKNGEFYKPYRTMGDKTYYKKLSKGDRKC